MAELAVFSASLYFQYQHEQEAFCQFVGFCPRPRTEAQQEYFEQGTIHENGYVENAVRPKVDARLSRSTFVADPAQLITRLTETRHCPSLADSHVGRIIIKGLKPLSEPCD